MTTSTDMVPAIVTATVVRKPRMAPVRQHWAQLADTARMHMIASEHLLAQLERTQGTPLQVDPVSVRAVMLTTERLHRLLDEAPSLLTIPTHNG